MIIRTLILLKTGTVAHVVFANGGLKLISNMHVPVCQHGSISPLPAVSSSSSCHTCLSIPSLSHTFLHIPCFFANPLKICTGQSSLHAVSVAERRFYRSSSPSPSPSPAHSF